MKILFGKKETKREDMEMKNTFASKLKELRRERGMSQEQLASVCGVSVQAVSKWECEQSYPDIELLETIADTFNVTIDGLLRGDADVHAPVAEKKEEKPEDVEARLLAAISEKFGVPVDKIGRVDVRMSTGDETISIGADADGTSASVTYDNELPDDDVLRVVQYRGRRRLDVREYDHDIKIPLMLNGMNDTGEIKVEIWGSADVTLDSPGCGIGFAAGGDITVNGGPVNGPVSAGGDVKVRGESVNGPVYAGGDVHVDDCINAPVNAGGDIECSDIAGNVSAGGDIDCGDIAGPATAGGDISCSDIGGPVTAGSDIDCGDIGGSASAGGDIDCGDVGGSASAGGNLDCGEVGGDVSADGDVDCGDIGGDVNAGGDVSCGDVEGDVNAGGCVDCGDVEGDVCAGSASFGEVKGESRRKGKDVTIKGKGVNMPDIDLSNLGEYVNRTVNEALEAAFGKKKKQDDDAE